jgi:hypothetical protein
MRRRGQRDMYPDLDSKPGMRALRNRYEAGIIAVRAGADPYQTLWLVPWRVAAGLHLAQRRGSASDEKRRGETLCRAEEQEVGRLVTMHPKLRGRVRQVGDCLMWTGYRDKYGYGRVYVDGKQVLTHRLAYETQVGPIPSGLVIDHLCRNPPCINPAHMEPVTIHENANVRGGLHGVGLNALATHCKHGHEFNEENTYIRKGSGRRDCRVCGRERVRRYLQRKKAA